jgi:hypothetical protein
VPFAHTFIKGKGRGKDVQLLGRKNIPQALWEPVKSFLIDSYVLTFFIDSYVLILFRDLSWALLWQQVRPPCYMWYLSICVSKKFLVRHSFR